MGVLLALLVGVVGFFAVPASPALADEHPQLEVRINAVSPALIDPTDEGQLVTITGTVTNTSARDMRYVNVHFWRSRQPLTGLDEINDAVSAPLSSPLGSRLDSLESGNLDLLAAEDPFPPGETANFTVQATVAQLELPTVSDAVYRLGVHVRAIPNGDSNTTVGRARVLVPASPLDLPVSATVLLSSRPVAHADGDPINQQESARLLSELTGRLETLLAAAERPNVVGIIDPELYRTVGILAEGNDEAPPNEAAQRWLQRVDRLAAENRLWRLPAGDPHLARADAVGLLDQVLSDTDGGALSAIPLAAVLGETGSEDLAERLTDVDHLVARHAQGVSRRVMEGRAPRVPPALADGTDAEHRGYLLATELLPGTPVNYLLATEEQVTQERLLDGYREHIAPPRYARLTPTWSRALPAPRWTGLADELRRVDAQQRAHRPRRRAVGPHRIQPLFHHGGGSHRLDGILPRGFRRSTQDHGAIRPAVRVELIHRHPSHHDHQRDGRPRHGAAAFPLRYSATHQHSGFGVGHPAAGAVPNPRHHPAGLRERRHARARPVGHGVGRNLRHPGDDGDHGDPVWACRMDHHRDLGCSSAGRHRFENQGRPVRGEQ